MAAGGLLALLDDITALLDDIAVMTKVAAVKTSGIVGDDLAVNAQSLVGIDPKRELPIVWRVAKGSLRNKLVLVPSALFLAAFAEWAITPLLMIGGAFLCYEAAEKVIHVIKPEKEEAEHDKAMTTAAHTGADALMEIEKKRIAEAVNTDFILSAEIIAVALGAVKTQEFAVQAGVLSGVGLGMTVFVYGLVGCIIKLDDLGLYLTKSKSTAVQKLGFAILKSVPYLMKTLSVAGTIAMFSVGGGIILHGIPAAAEAMHDHGGLLNILVSTGAGFVVGLAVVPVAHKLGGPGAILMRKIKTKIGERLRKEKT